MPKTTTAVATTNSAIANIDPTLLAELGDLASQYNEGAVSDNKSIPMLKIQMSTEAETKRGTFVLGQKIDGINVVNEGIQIDKIIILAMRDRFSYYNLDDKERAKQTACRSRMFVRHHNMEPIVGNNYGYVCGADCKFRAKDLKTKCSAQHVVFALAIYNDAEGNRVEQPCIMYLKGCNFMPITDFLKKAVYLDMGGKQVKLPIFGFEVKLSTEKKINGSVVYFEIGYERGEIIVTDKERFNAIKAHADDAIKAIDAMNENFAKGLNSHNDDDDEMPAKPSDPIDVTPKSVKVASAPWDETADIGDVTDIEAMISAKLSE